MKTKLRRDSNARLIGTAVGSLTLDDMKAAAQAASDLEEVPREILWDLRDATFSLTAEQIRHLAEHLKSTSRIPVGSKMAFVVTGDLQFGLVRMFEALRSEPGLEIRVFREWSEADDWISGPRV